MFVFLIVYDDNFMRQYILIFVKPFFIFTIFLPIWCGNFMKLRSDLNKIKKESAQIKNINEDIQYEWFNV